MLQHLVLWNYASVWKPATGAAWVEGQALCGRGAADVDPADPERLAFTRLMGKVRSGAAPAWWASTDRLGHG